MRAWKLESVKKDKTDSEAERDGRVRRVIIIVRSIEESGVLSCVFILFVYRVVNLIPQKGVELKSFSRSVGKVVRGCGQR